MVLTSEERSDLIATTPEPPYVAIIFTSIRMPGDDGYEAMAAEMVAMGSRQPGFLGIESARDSEGLGITVTYWETLEHAHAWKEVAEHRAAQQLGRERWYRSYKTRIARVERDYGFERA
jgi:heme-degrading monooxygenase HmoA